MGEDTRLLNLGEISSHNLKKISKTLSQKSTLIRNLDQLKVNPQMATLGKAHGKRCSQKFSLSQIEQNAKMSFIFSRISRQNKTMSNTFKNCQTRLLDRNARVSDLGDFWTTLKNQLANTPPTLETSSIRLVVTGRARNALSHVEQGKARASTCEGREMPWGWQAWGAYLANVEINTNTKAKLKSQTNIWKTRGTPNDFGEKTGKFDTYTFGERRKLRGENCEPRKNNTVRLETRTQGQFDNDAVCTNTNALRLPLIPIRKVLRHSKKKVQKSHRKLISPRGQQNTYTPKTKAENKSSKSSPGSESCDHRSNRRGIFDVLSSSSSSSFTARNGWSFPSSESSQRSIKNENNVYYF